LLKAGFQNLIINGIELVVDSHCATGAGTADIWLLNTRYLDFFLHSDAAFKMFPYASAVNQPDVKTASIIMSGNLANSNCRMHKRLYNVNTTN
jgi:hypothetical protein